MLVMGLDFETQDDQPKTTNVTEVGAVLYQVDLETNEFNKMVEFSHFCYEPEYPPQTEKIISLTGITDEMLKTFGKPREGVFRELMPMVRLADIILCHKISFDETILKATCEKFSIELPKKEFLCTLTNFPWPPNLTCHKLSHLAYEHDIPHDRKSLHRAVNDVDLMIQTIAKYNFKEVLEYARKPWIYFKATILEPWKDGGLQASIAKSFGFTFESVKGTDTPRWSKTWVSRTKSLEKLEEIKSGVAVSASPFRVAVIEGIT